MLIPALCQIKYHFKLSDRLVVIMSIIILQPIPNNTPYLSVCLDRCPLHGAGRHPDGLLFGRLLCLPLVLVERHADGALRVVERRLVLGGVTAPLVPVTRLLVGARSAVKNIQFVYITKQEVTENDSIECCLLHTEV